MKIDIRRVDKYINIKVEVDSTKINLGLHDVIQALEFTESLIQATQDINNFCESQLFKESLKEKPQSEDKEIIE